jgi:ATP/ADP translocase
MSLKDSAAYLGNSAYIRNLAALVICYGMSINIVEVGSRPYLRCCWLYCTMFATLYLSCRPALFSTHSGHTSTTC